MSDTAFGLCLGAVIGVLVGAPLGLLIGALLAANKRPSQPMFGPTPECDRQAERLKELFPKGLNRG